MQLLDRPAASHEMPRERIEQFRVSRFFTQQTEIVGRTNQSLTKMPAPDPVHDDATGQRMLGIHNPFCQFHSSAVCAVEFWSRTSSNDAGNFSRDNVAQ